MAAIKEEFRLGKKTYDVEFKVYATGCDPDLGIEDMYFEIQNIDSSTGMSKDEWIDVEDNFEPSKPLDTYMEVY